MHESDDNMKIYIFSSLDRSINSFTTLPPLLLSLFCQLVPINLTSTSNTFKFRLPFRRMASIVPHGLFIRLDQTKRGRLSWQLFLDFYFPHLYSSSSKCLDGTSATNTPYLRYRVLPSYISKGIEFLMTV